MKKLMLASAGLAALAVAAPAMAADLPAAPVYKAPVVVPMQIYDWTGFYVGLNAGYSWGRSATDFTFAGFPLFSATQNLNGWVAGGQAGYNWQFNRNWIFGIEADLQATGQKGTLNAVAGPACTAAGIPGTPAVVTTCATSTASLEQKLPWLGTGRLRLGFLPADHWMLYVTGGVAVAEVETDASLTTTTTTSTSINGVTFPGATTTALALANANTTRVGWTVGGGAEWVISGPWTGKLEYLYVDLGNVSNTYTVAGVPFLTTSSHVTDNIVRVGLNYRFGGPVIAKY
jgi:outer membrane immunogenic protein